jgi:hypothetical protein
LIESYKTGFSAEDEITCHLSTSHGVWAVGLVHADDVISVSSYSSSLSTVIK